MPLYEYQPLDRLKQEIRVLHVKPGAWTDPLICTLHKTSLGDSNFDCLSYAWGKQVPSLDIYVDDLALKVTPNVEAALRHLRQEVCHVSNVDTLNIWIDGVCINQADDVEKGVQVGMMNLIYSHATVVHVWLGEIPLTWQNDVIFELQRQSDAAEPEGTPPDRRLEEWVKETSKSSVVRECSEVTSTPASENPNTPNPEHYQTDPNEDFAQLLAFIYMLQAEEQHPDIYTEVLGASSNDPEAVSSFIEIDIPGKWRKILIMLLWLLKRPWWSRLWVIQEVALPKAPPMLHFGSLHIDFADFEKGLNRLLLPINRIFFQVNPSVRVWITMDVIQSAMFMYKLARTRRRIQSGQSLLLEQLSSENSWHQASNPKDYLYGALGLIDLSQSELVQPDYTLSKTAGDVFCETTWSLFRHYGDLRHLYYASGFERDSDSDTEFRAPSWCINWRRTRSLHITPERCGRSFPPYILDAVLPDESRQTPVKNLTIQAAYIGQYIGSWANTEREDETESIAERTRRSYQEYVRSAVYVGSAVAGVKFPDDGRIQKALFPTQFADFYPTSSGKPVFVDPYMLTMWCQSTINYVDGRSNINFVGVETAAEEQRFKSYAASAFSLLDEMMRKLLVRTPDERAHFFATSQGKLGHARFRVECDDELFAIPNCHHTAVLRPCDVMCGTIAYRPGTSQQYMFLGFCYLEDFDMHKIIRLPEGSSKCEAEALESDDEVSDRAYGSLRPVELC